MGLLTLDNIIGLPNALNLTWEWLNLAKYGIVGAKPKELVQQAEKVYSSVGLNYTPEQKYQIYKPIDEAIERKDEWVTKKYVLNYINPMAQPTEAKGLQNLDLGNIALILGLSIAGIYLLGKYIGKK